MDSFCIHPWTRLRVEPGGVGICCIYRGGKISRDGVPMLPDQHSLEDVWNSDELRAVRRDMVAGKAVSGCEECYQNEASGGTSMRMRDNASWENGWLNDENTTIEALRAVAQTHDFHLPFMPVSIEVDTGSLCNLKCRMCHGAVSSRIAKDSVHGTWALDTFADSPYHDETLSPRAPNFVRFPKGSFINNVPSYVEHVKRLYFIGGEPTLVKELRDILVDLVESGNAPRIELALVSNGTVTRSWLDLTRHFKKLQLAISIDGFGKIYDYIRFPYRWDDLVRNLAAFQGMDHVGLGAAVTLQANNLLNVTDLFRYLDGMNIGFYCYPLYVPRHLAVWAMSASVRRVAAERLQHYAETDCRAPHRDMVLGLAKQVAPDGQACDPRLLRQFMMFTNDLDISRGQSIHQTELELVELLADDGFAWSDTTLHAPNPAALAAVARRPVAGVPHESAG